MKNAQKPNFRKIGQYNCQRRENRRTVLIIFLNQLQNNIYIYFVNMNTNTLVLSIKTKTWYKDSHSLFDYQSTKINEQSFDLAMPLNQVAIFRKRNSSALKILTRNEQVDPQAFQLLTYFNIKPSGAQKIYKLEFTEGDYRKKGRKHERMNTEESNSSREPKESTYLVVNKFIDLHGNPLGFKLNAGQIVKLGRVQYFVSEISFGGRYSNAVSKTKTTICNRKVHRYEDQVSNGSGEINPCKFCLEEEETQNNFMLSPCRCTGSCGSVHIKCLQEWIHMKVKKETVGGTKHFNFQKFECEVCKTEFPMIIEKEGKNLQLLPLEKPNGNYLILQAACQKTKSVMLITNLGLGGIKLGRGHQCEIRITDISVSRNHALIKQNLDGFYIYDNKSKFGTLVKEQGNFQVEIGQAEKAVQIGRTFISLQIAQKRVY